MKEVFLVKDENKNKAEMTLKEDEVVNRGSITFTQAINLDIDEEGYFCIIDCSEDGVEKAKELLKDIAEVYENKDEVLKKQEDAENSATEAFGNILG